MRATVLALPIALTGVVNAQTATYQLTADPAASGVAVLFDTQLTATGTLIGDFDPVDNPAGTQTRPGLFGGSGNQPVPVNVGLLITSDIATTPSGAATLRIDDPAAPASAELEGLDVDLLSGESASVDLAVSLLYSTFRTINPGFLYPGGFALEIPLGSADITTLRVTQTAVATAALVPDGGGAFTLVALVPADLAFEASSPLGPIGPAVAPVTLPLSATLTLDAAATLVGAFALDGLSTEVDIADLPALENQPFELPTLDPNVTAGVLFTLSPQALTVALEGSFTVTLRGEPTFAGCNEADLAEAFGTLDVNDILAFAAAFSAADAAADLFPAGGDGTLDINDVLVFASAFSAGCP